MKEIENVVIVGMGSLGTLYGSLIYDALGTEHVSYMMDEERLSRYRGRPCYANGREYHFRCISPAEAEIADLVIVAVKATGLERAIEEIAPCVGQETAIMSVMNGISSEEILAERFGREHLIYTVAQGMAAMKTGDSLKYDSSGTLVIGNRYPDQEENLERIAAFLTKCGISYRIEDDILHRLWSKFMLNTGVNQSCMVYGCAFGDVCVEGEPRDTMFGAMREVIAVAVASGIMLSERDMEEYDAIIRSLDPEGLPSMAQDRVAGRPSEVESFSGTVIRLGQEYDIPTPVNEWLYTRVREIESAYPS